MKACRKFLLVTLAAGAMFFTTCSSNNITDNNINSEKIGKSGPGGGIVFFDKGNSSGGWRYLEAALEDQSTGIQWYNEKNIETGATGTEIGTGRLNTQKIIKAQGNGMYAAIVCTNYKGGGKNDWFLPSKDELNLMYTRLKAAGIGKFSNRHYWSSSEIDAKYAWSQSFVEGIQFDKSAKEFIILTSVRAIRAY